MADEITQPEQQVNGQIQISDPDYFSSMFGDDIDDGFRFNFNDSGAIEIAKREATGQEAETSTESEGVASASADTVLGDAASQESVNPSDTALVGRITQLESQQNQIIEMLQRLDQTFKGNNNLGGQQQQQQQQYEEEVDLSDPRQLRSFIAQTMKQELTPLLQPLQQTQQKTELYMAYSDAVSRHGQSFIEQLPAIKELMVANPSLSFDTAFDLVKTVLKTQKTLPVQDGGNQKQVPPQAPRVQPAQTAKQLVQRAQQLKTQTGLSTVTQAKPVRYASMDEAADAAFAELFG